MTAAAPPSAETVWLRIGYTLEITATLSCGLPSATAIAARRPAPPPPTTSTSQLKRSILSPHFPQHPGPGCSIELSNAETPTSEVRQGCSRRMGVEGQGPASATTGMVTAGKHERSENPNLGHPAPPGDRTVHSRSSGSICKPAVSVNMARRHRDERLLVRDVA